MKFKQYGFLTQNRIFLMIYFVINFDLYKFFNGFLDIFIFSDDNFVLLFIILKRKTFGQFVSLL